MTQPSPSVDLTSGVLLAALALVWGGSFFFAEVALSQLPPLTITLFRVGLALPVLFLVVRIKGIQIPGGARIWGAYLGMGALNNALPFSLIFWGQTQIESGLASILNGTTAMFGAVMAGILLRDEPLTSQKLIGAALGFLGVAVIMGPSTLTSFDPRNLAQLAVLAAAFSYALASVWGKLFLAGQPPLMNALGMVVGSTVLMLPLVFYVEGMPRLDLSAEVWCALIGIAVLSTALAYLMYFDILRRAGSANLMLVTLLIPPVAVGLGAGFLGETLSREAFLGFLVIGLGLVVTDGRLFKVIANRRHRPADAPE
ncbi:possible transporter, DME family, DMT superfamily protein [Roseobacter sp. MED193]|uniref:DMT family transporter n=1 Tax=Roseobacter sp. MED193 TaxID=314262 RepID=UPI000068A62C|nr:DMT family transporter [Roseobacter sp. MED193]EAQ43388.1 possible transporter, DME family, DMT superfamily protein [Roseobacter sp. MED193]